ncbi:hypothetical protein F4693_002245 [Sphingomonas endophytica]|uniref:Uncharacterized protein n=1 Tax=Sphingomonas endophytica TaxID=869719 RepID=A0A7X0JEN2_9SPHN|nr:protealysin inhibitor emfourin [Sphingomonas endophytica]MBB6505257.1 hypothetical protein [Sphingomonas endophytica]
MADEARLRVEGGFAHFPGRARDHAVALDDLDPPVRAQLCTLAEAADFFGCAVPDDTPRPDARTYTLGLTLGERTRELRVAEPIRDPALAELVSAVRRLGEGRG